MKVAFLDRDGVINNDVHLLHRVDQFELIPRSSKAIKLLNESGYTVVVVTNQGVVARGMMTEEKLHEVHEYMVVLLAKEGAHIDRIYYCPHHPTKGNIAKLSIECECRKPNPGMLLQAKKELGLDSLEDCFIVGDKMSDLEAGRRAGLKDVLLVKTGHGGSDQNFNLQPSYVATDLYDAVRNFVLK